jgi:hypothetical protein
MASFYNGNTPAPGERSRRPVARAQSAAAARRPSRAVGRLPIFSAMFQLAGSKFFPELAVICLLTLQSTRRDFGRSWPASDWRASTE